MMRHKSAHLLTTYPATMDSCDERLHHGQSCASACPHPAASAPVAMRNLGAGVETTRSRALTPLGAGPGRLRTRDQNDERRAPEVPVRAQQVPRARSMSQPPGVSAMRARVGDLLAEGVDTRLSTNGATEWDRRARHRTPGAQRTRCGSTGWHPRAPWRASPPGALVGCDAYRSRTSVRTTASLCPSHVAVSPIAGLGPGTGRRNSVRSKRSL
jgi:hypothetical protein